MRRPADIGPPPVVERNRDQAPAALRVRLWPEEGRLIADAARRAGLPVKEWALRVLLRAADPRSERELRRLVDLLDGDCTLPDGSSADTTWAHAVLGDFRGGR